MATAKQRQKVEKVMHEYKEGDLKSGRSGRKVKNPKQAIAIAMSESGQSRKGARKGASKGASKKRSSGTSTGRKKSAK